MPKVSFRMASASRKSVFGVQTSTARKNHRSGHTEGRLTTTPSRCSTHHRRVTPDRTPLSDSHRASEPTHDGHPARVRQISVLAVDRIVAVVVASGRVGAGQQPGGGSYEVAHDRLFGCSRDR